MNMFGQETQIEPIPQEATDEDQNDSDFEDIEDETEIIDTE